LTATIAVIGLGIAAGGEYDAVIYLSSRYFGLRAFGFLFGLVMSAVLLGVGFAPYITALIYDATGSYHLFLVGSIPIALFAGVLVAGLGRYPVHSVPEPVQKSA